MLDDFIEIQLGSSFLINAGICGLIKLLEFSKAEEGMDYEINGQVMKLSKEFLMSRDISDLYVKAMVNNFKETTRFYDILQKRHIVESIYAGKEELSKDDIDNINKIFKEAVQMLEKNSFKSGYIILNEYYNISKITDEIIARLKKEKNLEKEIGAYLEICNILDKPEVQEVLIFKELMYSKMNMFLGDTSFFLSANLKKDIRECYKKDFVQPLLDEVAGTKKKTKRCIECSNLAYNTKSISFMIDSTDDVSRKKSHYWNLKPDAFVCPVCAFLYTLVPLGFQFLGSDAIFINNNSSINAMCRIMRTYESKDDENLQSTNKSKFYRIFTDQKIDMLENKIYNIQVIIKSKNKEHFEINVISKDTIKKIVDCKKHLKHLERKYIKQNDSFISVYDEVIDNIFFKRSQYQLMHELFLYELKNNGNTNYIKDILMIEITFRGGVSMNSIKKNVDISWRAGIAMRNKLTETVQEKDIDNSLRSLVYKLSNALSVGNCEQYLDSIIRVYSGKGIPIPYIFKECYESEEMFKAIGQGFILGLKYNDYESNNKINIGGE